jgi:hypothetical protein
VGSPDREGFRRTGRSLQFLIDAAIVRQAEAGWAKAGLNNLCMEFPRNAGDSPASASKLTSRLFKSCCGRVARVPRANGILEPSSAG